MLKLDDTVDHFISTTQNEFVRIGDFVCSLKGSFIYKDNKAGQESLHSLIMDYESNRMDFNKMMGGYRVAFENLKTGEVVFFGDNSNIACFYIDSHSLKFSNSFLDLISGKEKLVPNFNAIAQFLKFDFLYGIETLCSDVTKTDSDYYYTIKNSNISKSLKNLIPLEKLNDFNSLHEIMEHILKANCDEKMVAIITGGSDSRSILANIVSLGKKIDTAITGEEGHPDVIIARQIAKILNLSIIVSDEQPTEKDWIKDSFRATDGQYGAFSRYRLYKHVKIMREHGYTLEFGGVAGEIYKNNFIDQDFPFYNSSKTNFEKFYKFEVQQVVFPSGLFTEKINKVVEDGILQLKEKLKSFIKPDRNKFQNYNEMGLYLLKQRQNTLTNSATTYLSVIQPLVERHTVSLIFNNNPYSMGFQNFQRNEVTKYCPDIKDIKTVYGYTCNNSKLKVLGEIIKYAFKNGKTIGAHILNLRGKYRPRIDACFKEGFLSKECGEALDVCCDLGIINKDFDVANIPPGIVDILVTVGLVFSRKYYKDVF